VTRPDIVILAGGQASRLGGGDKCLLPLAGDTVLGHILRRLAGQGARCAINANGDPARFAGFGRPVLADSIEGRPGPLAGVLTAMEWAETPDVVTVPADAPFIPFDLIVRLLAARDAAGADIAVAASGGRLHPVIALWPVRLAPDLHRAIGQGVRKVENWIAGFQAVRVTFSAEPVDPFFNINQPEDLIEAESLYRQDAETPHAG
jgi:molybdopterin-guanine dinucleotide biosynthesis protein A